MNNERANNPKKQHWVPQFYLREFSIPETRNTKEPKVWAFSRNEGEPAVVNVKDMAAKRYLYSPKGPEDSRSFEMETKLAELESVVGGFWPALANDFVDLNAIEIRKGLSLFISTLLLRHPKEMERQRGLHRKLVDFFDALPKDASGRPNVSHLETKNGIHEVDTSDWFSYRDSTQYDHQKSFVGQIRSDAMAVAELFMKKRWSILLAEEPCFITTDAPVTLLNRAHTTFGVTTKGTIISCPLSPTRVLIMDDRSEEPCSQYYPLDAIGSAPINLIHWTHAHNFMISHRHPDAVNHEMLSFVNDQGKSRITNGVQV